MTAITGLAVPVDGTAPVVVTIDNGDLDTYQRLVAGRIEAIYISIDGHPATMYLNENGKAGQDDGDPAMLNNDLATYLAAPRLQQGDWIVGPVLLVGDPDHDGDDTSLPAATLTAIADLLDQQHLTPTTGPRQHSTRR